MDQSSHIPPSCRTSWLALLQLSILQVVQVQWRVPGKGNPFLASAAVSPVQLMKEQLRPFPGRAGRQQLWQHRDLPGGGCQGRSFLCQTSAQQQPGTNFRFICKFFRLCKARSVSL